MKIFSVVFLLCVSIQLSAQGNWQWTEVDTMPMRTANNAVCEALINGNRYVYSFTGIDTSKTYSGIHLKSFKYNVNNDSWSEMPDVPDTLGKIAAGASFVNNKIYLMGGYHVFANNTEISSNKVHVFNPLTDTWEADGPAIPVPIDDHVQAVWRDSLIYLVTGWSNSGNVPDVQIYDPYQDTWSIGTATPNNNFFKAFGASGYILDDTIYYQGGVAGTSAFVARKYMRKGIINPNNPTEITWLQLDDSPGEPNYRAACSGHGKKVFWIGGSATGYNYDGIAYNGSGGVDPEPRVLEFNAENAEYVNYINAPEKVMDLRGIAKIGGGSWIIAGGMDTTQLVSNKTFLLYNEEFSGIDQIIQPPFFEVRIVGDNFQVRTEFAGKVSVFDISGRLLYSDYKFLADMFINRNKIKENMLIFLFDDGSNVPVFQKVVSP